MKDSAFKTSPSEVINLFHKATYNQSSKYILQLQYFLSRSTLRNIFEVTLLTLQLVLPGAQDSQ